MQTQAQETDRTPAELAPSIHLMPGCTVRWSFEPEQIRILDANWQYCAFFGLSQEDLDQYPFLGLSDSERSCLWSQMYPLALEHQPICFSQRGEKTDGSSCWLRVEGYWSMDQNGCPVYDGLVVDITDIILVRRQLEDMTYSLKNAQDEISAYQRLISGMIIVSGEGSYQLLYGSDSFFRMIGYSREQFVLECQNSPLSLSAEELDYGSLLPALKQNGKVSARWTFRCRNHTVRSVRADLFAVTAPEESHPVYHIMFADFDLPSQEHRDYQNQVWMRSVMEHSGNSGISVRQTGKTLSLLYISPNIAAILGYSESELLYLANFAYTDLIHPEDIGQLRRQYWEAAHSQDPLPRAFEYRACKKDGSYIWVYDSVCLTTDQSGEPYLLSILFNITALKMRELNQNMDMIRNADSLPISFEQEQALLSGKDALLHIFTRDSFERNAENLIEKLDPQGTSKGALLILDLDHFGRINDELGHVYCEEVLLNAVKDLQAKMRSDDLLGRLGGGELFVYLHNVPNQSVAIRRADEFRVALRKQYDNEITLTVSIGVALTAEDCTTFEELYFRANKALYRARKKNGNCVVCFEQGDARGSVMVPGTHSQMFDDINHSHIYIRTFGSFDVFVDGKPLEFQSKKAKELLALLVDYRGGIVTNADAVAALWEDEVMSDVIASRYRNTAARLKKALDTAGIGNIVINQKRGRSIDMDKVACDLYLYMADNWKYRKLFTGQYMTNYSWSEATLATLLSQQNE
ncbi:MAG: hypothetical protein H6Q60_477 [Oscillospiraceae bacterium]|nr:hypothetical protein [Oscillospiraceae bacterium]